MHSSTVSSCRIDQNALILPNSQKTTEPDLPSRPTSTSMMSNRTTSKTPPPSIISSISTSLLIIERTSTSRLMRKRKNMIKKDSERSPLAAISTDNLATTTVGRTGKNRQPADSTQTGRRSTRQTQECVNLHSPKTGTAQGARTT